MTQYAIALVNMRDGSVQGHKAGCADLKRGARKFADEPWTLEVASKRDAFLEYNCDFLAEAEAEGDYSESNTYEINWLPCANHVPEGEVAEREPEQADEFANLTPEQREQALKNFTDLAENAPSEAARTFWQGKADAIR